MLEAHFLPHLLAASLSAAQPSAAADSALATAKAGIAAAVPQAAPSPDAAPPVAAAAPTTVAPTLPQPAPATTPGLRDPLQGLNRISYAISQPIDRFLIRPAALTYQAVVPHPLRDGARNFIRNVFEPVVFLNDLLQLRPKRALHTLARMALNTTLGLVGIFDVAKRPPFHLLHHENGLGDTLGYYGIGPGAYVYLPVLGPSTLRDMVGEVGDAYAEPRLLEHLVHPDSDKSLLRAPLRLGRYAAIVDAVSGLDRRAQSDSELRAIQQTSVDPYAALRSSYLQDRAGEIASLKAHDGRAAVNPSLDDPLLDPAMGR